MSSYSLSHVSDPDLLRGLASLVAQDRATTARLLAHVGEVDARRLYLPAAHPSMYSYCVHELRLSEDAAYKRIRVARVARHFPVIFEALADGRLHLSAVVLLTPYLSQENAAALLAAAAHKTKSEIEELIAERFPRPEDYASSACQLVPGPVGTHSKVAPIAPGRFRIELTIEQETHDMLRYAQELLGHTLPSGDVGQVLKRALEALIEQLERRKFAATTRPRRSGHASANPRHLPAHVRRAVWERDGGQCTFVSQTGRRCPARKLLEFDHIEEVARGGRASVAGIRLRCRAHNQYGAECAFGAGFMRHKREAARREAAEAQARAAAEEVITPLRLLGLSAEEARRAAALCESIPDATLEQRVRRALSYLHPRGRTFAPAAPSPGASP
jgi:hypothetical protein